MERENLCLVTPPGVKGQAASGSNREGASTEAGRKDGAARSSVEGPVMGVRRDKAALSSGCKAHPAIRSRRKQPEQAWRRRNV
jgi:hypothetical protein